MVDRYEVLIKKIDVKFGLDGRRQLRCSFRDSGNRGVRQRRVLDKGPHSSSIH